MNEWVERLVLCKQWLRQNEEQLLTGGGWWIRKGAKSRRRVIGRNHSFPGGRQARPAGEDATRMPLCQVAMSEIYLCQSKLQTTEHMLSLSFRVKLKCYWAGENERTPKSTVLSKKSRFQAYEHSNKKVELSLKIILICAHYISQFDHI